MPLVTIDVTQDDIDKGEPRCPCGCPVWCAVKPHLKSGIGFSVTWFTGWLSPLCSNELVQFPFADPVASFIRAFDDGEPVTPFTFQLDIPAEFLREPCTKS